MKRLLTILFTLAFFVSIAQQQFNFQGNASGTNTYTASITGVSAYTSSGRGIVVHIKFTNANSGASTLNINSLGAISLKKDHGNSDLESGDIEAGDVFTFYYDGTNFQISGSGQSISASNGLNMDGNTVKISDAGNVDEGAAIISYNGQSVYTGSYTDGTEETGGGFYADANQVSFLYNDGVIGGNFVKLDTDGAAIKSTGLSFRDAEDDGFGWITDNNTIRLQNSPPDFENLDLVTKEYVDGAVSGGAVPSSRLINTTSPLAGGGDLTADLTLSIANAAADGSTKGAASFSASDFNSSSGNITIDYTNGQTATNSTKGFLTAADWTTFNAKQATGLSWLLASGGAMTGNNTVGGAFAFTMNNSQSGANTTAISLAPSWTQTANTQTGTAFDLATTFTIGAFTGARRIIARMRDVASTSDAMIVTSQGSGTIHNIGINAILGTDVPASTVSMHFFNNNEPIRMTQNSASGSVRMSMYQSSTLKGDIQGTGSSNTIPNAVILRSMSGPVHFQSNNVDAGGVASNQMWYVGSLFTPTSTLHVNGTIASGINTTALTTNTTLDATREDWIFDTTAGNITASLPDATTCIGRVYVVYNISASNTLAVDPNGSQTINGSSSNYNISGTAYGSVMIKSAGALGWVVRAEN